VGIEGEIVEVRDGMYSKHEPLPECGIYVTIRRTLLGVSFSSYQGRPLYALPLQREVGVVREYVEALAKRVCVTRLPRLDRHAETPALPSVRRSPLRRAP
jgi:hypothetical protein